MTLRFFLFIACFITLSSFPAHAQNSQNGDGIKIPDPMSDSNDEAIEPLTAPATEDAMKLAITYYDQCMKAPDPGLSYNSQQATCSCEAANVKDGYTAGQIKTILGQQRGEKIDRIDVMNRVQGPCMYFGAKEFAYNQCASSKNVVKFLQTAEQLTFLCGCVGDKMSTYFKDFAPYQLAAVLKVHPQYSDPMGAVMISSEYRSEFNDAIDDCSKQAYQLRVDPETLKKLYHQ